MSNFTYYVRKEDDLYVLRQQRFRHLKEEHPHDVCATNPFLSGIKSMAEIFTENPQDVDYSEVENVQQS